MELFCQPVDNQCTNHNWLIYEGANMRLRRNSGELLIMQSLCCSERQTEYGDGKSSRQTNQDKVTILSEDKTTVSSKCLQDTRSSLQIKYTDNDFILR